MNIFLIGVVSIIGIYYLKWYLQNLLFDEVLLKINGYYEEKCYLFKLLSRKIQIYIRYVFQYKTLELENLLVDDCLLFINNNKYLRVFYPKRKGLYNYDKKLKKYLINQILITEDFEHEILLQPFIEDIIDFDNLEDYEKKKFII